MTESQWLSSTDPAAMLAYLRERGLATEALLRAFVVACRETASPARTAWEWDISTEEGLRIAASDWSTEFYQGMDFRPRAAAILRDVFGNPFRSLPCMKLPGPHTHPLNEEWQHPSDGWRWLIWNDGTVPKLARSILGGEEKCEACGGSGWISFNKKQSGMTCPDCCGKGTGKTPPNFADMPILADALEESGCANEEILRHCRGFQVVPLETMPCICNRCGRTENRRHWSVQSRCQKCRGSMRRPDDKKIPFESSTSKAKERKIAVECGWRPGVVHARGCWVLRLLMGGNE